MGLNSVLAIKELQDDIIAAVNINLYDFGARMYDPELCRWHVVDPMAALSPNITPYRYGFNNPIRFTDPNGMYERDDYGDEWGDEWGDDGWPTREEALDAAHSRGFRTGLFGDWRAEENEDGSWDVNNQELGLNLSLLDDEEIESLRNIIGLNQDNNEILGPLAFDFTRATLEQMEKELQDEIISQNNEMYEQNCFERAGEWADGWADDFAQIFVKLFPPTVLVDAPKTIATGVDINNNVQKGVLNRYISPTMSLFGAIIIANPGVTVNTTINVINTMSTGNNAYTVEEEIRNRAKN